MAKTNDYRLKEYPEPKNLLEQLLGNYKRTIRTQAIKEELGSEGFQTYLSIKRIKAMVGTVQARLPVDFIIE
jgi:protease-4